MLAGSNNTQELAAANQGFQTHMAVSAGQWVVSGDTTIQEVSRELGLRFWRELATVNNVTTNIHLESFAGANNPSEGRLKVLCISDRAELQTALLECSQYGIVSVGDEQQAAEVLKQDSSIIAMLIDASLMRSTPAEWLGELRKQLAWSGIPVLFLLPAKAQQTKELLESFHAHVMECEGGVTKPIEIIRELQNILTK